MDPMLLLLALGGGVGLAVAAIRFGQRSVAREQLGIDAPAERIVPRIRTRDYVRAMRAAGARGDDLPVTEPLIDELIVAYGFDMPAMFRMLTPRDLARLRLSAMDLRSLAVRNLATKLRDRVEVQSIGPLFQVSTGENSEASVLLLDRFWRAQAERTRGELVVSVPTRDVLLYADTHDPLALEMIVGVTDDAVRAATGGEAISRVLLVWRGGRWARYDADDDEPADDGEDE